MKKTYMLIFLLSLGFLSSCGVDQKNENKIYYSTGSVFSGVIDTNNSYVGYIKGDKMVNLATKVGGKVAKVFVKEGEYVKKGDLLVQLEGNEARAGYLSAGDIINSLIGMKNDTRLMFDDQIKSMESKVEQVILGKKGVDNGLIDTINITNAQLETAKIGFETAKTNLEHTKLVLETKKGHIYDNMKDAVVGSVILDTNIMNFIDTLLGVTEENKDKNDLFENYLAAKNTGLYNESKLKFRDVNKTYIDYKKYYDEYIDGKKPSNNEIFIAIEKGELVAEEIKSLLSITYDVLDYSIDNVNLSNITINNYKSQISLFGSDIESSLLTISGDYILGLKGSRQNLADFEKGYTMQINLLTKQVELAESTLNQYNQMSKGQVNDVTTKSNVVSKQLVEIKAGLDSLKKQKESKLKEIDTKIAEAKGQQSNAGIMINNGKIFSPITGVITKKMLEVGQVVGGGMPLLTISNTDKLIVNVNISQELSKNIKINDRVVLNIDGLVKQINGYISNINLSKDMITKKVGIEVTLTENNNIAIGSFTRVIFNNNSGKKEKLITNEAIISQFMIPGVYVLNDGIIKFKNIEILKQNDNYSVVNGLDVGETIIIKGKENIFDGEVLK